MMEFLDRLRAKPLHERKTIAFGTTISLFAVIVVVWWTTFTSPLSTETVKATDNVASPVAVMGNFWGKASSEAKNMTGQLKDYMQNAATGTGKSSTNTGDQALVSDLLSNGSTTSAAVPEPTPKPQAAPTPPAAPTVAPTPVAPPPPTPSAPVEKKVSPPPPTPVVSPVPPPAPTPPAVLIPTRPGKIAP